MNAVAADIATADGAMDSYLAWPDGEGPFPLVIMFMDIWGLREELFALAREVAAQGYFCVLPNLFYRKGRIRIERRNSEGKTVSFETLPDDIKTEMLGLARGLTRDMIETDLTAIFEFARGKPANTDTVGVVGFCLGGRIAFFAGQSFPERVRAVSSLHGTLLVTEAADSPHRLAGRMKGEVYCGHGERDHSSTPEIINALEAAFRGLDQVAYHASLHPGAHHGYSMPDRDVHDAAAAALDWRETFAMFARRLKAPV